MNTKDFIIGFFTTREWASFTLVLLFVLLSARTRSGRGSISGVVKAFFHWKILLPIICAQIYLSIFAYALYKNELWNTAVLRETIFFLLYTSISLIFKYNSDSQRIASIKGIVEDTIKATLIVEFYLNIHTFSYWIELIIQFLLAFLFLLGTVNKRDTQELERTYGRTQTLFYGLSISLLIYSIYLSVGQWKENISSQNIISLLFPIIATLAYWPFLYILSVIKVYEEWFVRLRFRSSKEDYTYRRNSIFRKCSLNLSLINFVSRDFHMYIPQTKEQFAEDLHNSINRYINKNKRYDTTNKC